MMTASRDLRRPLQPTGTSLELDALAGAFNDLVQGLTAAEADTRAAYLGAIRALAATLDARDPYTAGHSERVSALSVLIGRQMGLGAAELDVLRLGALLHDIGKIGLSDAILDKARESFARYRFSHRTSLSSSSTTNVQTAVATRSGFAPTTSRWPRGLCMSPMHSTRSRVPAPIAPRALRSRQLPSLTGVPEPSSIPHRSTHWKSCSRSRPRRRSPRSRSCSAAS
jgi:hypothetical protein